MIETNHAFAELGGLLKERFGILLTSDQCWWLVENAKLMASGMMGPVAPASRWQVYGGHSGQPAKEVAA